MRRAIATAGRLWDAAGATAFLILFGRVESAYALTAVDVVKIIGRFVLWGALVFIYVVSFVGVAAGLKELILSGGQYGEGRSGWRKLIFGGLGIIIPTLLILFKIYVLNQQQTNFVPDFFESGPEGLQ